MLRTKFLCDVIDLIVREHELGHIEREDALVLAVRFARGGTSDAIDYLCKRFASATRAGWSEGDASDLRLEVAMLTETSIEFVPLTELGRRINRSRSALVRAVQRRARAEGRARDPKTAFVVGPIEVRKVLGKWMGRLVVAKADTSATGR